MVIVILPQKIGFSITACAPDQIQDTERMPVPIGVSFWGGPLLGVQKVTMTEQSKGTQNGAKLRPQNKVRNLEHQAMRGNKTF